MQSFGENLRECSHQRDCESCIFPFFSEYSIININTVRTRLLNREKDACVSLCRVALVSISYMESVLLGQPGRKLTSFQLFLVLCPNSIHDARVDENIMIQPRSAIFFFKFSFFYSFYFLYLQTNVFGRKRIMTA